MATSATSYQQLLDEALQLGRADGRFAASFEPATTAPRGNRCLGRTPEDFARLLWDDRPGTPPSGLELNAPLWYATGFDRGLAEGTCRRATTLQLRRVVS